MPDYSPIEQEALVHAHTAWVLALSQMHPEPTVVMTTDQARDALGAAFRAALKAQPSANPIDRDQQIKTEVANGRLVVSIGVDLLAHAVSVGDDWEEEWKVVDPDAFVAAVGRELESEEEDGTTLLHRAFDSAAMSVVESGDESVRCPGDDQ